MKKLFFLCFLIFCGYSFAINIIPPSSVTPSGDTIFTGENTFTAEQIFESEMNASSITADGFVDGNSLCIEGNCKTEWPIEGTEPSFSNPSTGTLNMSGFEIQNVGNVDGVDISAKVTDIESSTSSLRSDLNSEISLSDSRLDTVGIDTTTLQSNINLRLGKSADSNLDMNQFSIFDVSSITAGNLQGNNRIGIGTTLAPSYPVDAKNKTGEDSIQVWRQFGLNHGITDHAPIDVVGLVQTGQANGSFVFKGFSANNASPLQFQGLQGSQTSPNPTITFSARKKAGTGVGSLSATDIVSQFQNNGVALTTLLGDGNFGIGVISPTNRLSVAGSADFTGGIGIGTVSPTASLDVRGTISIGTNLTINAVIETPSSMIFNIDKNNDESDREFSIRSNISGAGAGGTPLLMIKETGNVGIGTTIPGEKLDVLNGNIKTNYGISSSTAIFTTDVDVNDEFACGSFTTSELDEKTPRKAGVSVFNSTLVEMCFSSGASVGAWVKDAAPTTACR